MGVVKYTGPVASFHCPTNAEIRSLKVHFSPKQEGTGDPSPENVRPIVGWDGVEVQQSGKNLLNIPNVTFSAYKKYDLPEPIPAGTYQLSAKIISSDENSTKSLIAFYNGGTSVGQRTFNRNVLEGGQITLNQSATKVYIYASNSYSNSLGDTATFENVQLETLSTITSYEPYQGSTTNYEFGVLGKNKFNAYDWQIDGTCINVENANSLTVSTIAYIENHNFYDINSTKGVQRILSFKAKTNSLTNDKASVSLSVRKDSGETPISSLTLKLNEKDYEEEYSLYIAPECDTIQFRNWGYAGSLTLSDIQLELGSTATTYEPYDPKNTVYGGWVDLISGEVCETHYGEALSECNSEALSNQYNTAQTTFFRCQHTYEHERGETYGTVKDLMCETLKSSATNWGSGDTQDEKVNTITERYNSYIAVCMRMYNSDLGIDTEDDNVVRKTKVNAYLAQHPLFICYKLRTPNIYHLAPTELQTFLGQNNVWSNADYVEAEYDLHETQEILNRKAFIMANQPHLVAQEAAQLQSFTTDLAAPLKECKVYFKPKQDLHWYSNPWSAGGGKNIAKPYDNNYVSSTYISFDYSASAGTFHCSGNASASSSHSSPSASNAISNNATFILPAGTYTLSIIDGDGAYIYAQCVSSTETVLAETTSYISFTTNEALTVFVRLKVAAGATVDNTVKIQLEKGSTATSYEPYENICPIEGWDELIITRAGANILNKNLLIDGGYISGNNTITSVSWYKYTDYIPCKPGTVWLWNTTVSSSTLRHICFFDINKTLINSFIQMEDGIAQSYIAPDNTCWMRLNISPSLVDIAMVSFLQPIIYSPYTFISHSFNFPSEIYGGYVDLMKGELVATHGIIICDGTEPFGYKSYWANMITFSKAPVLKVGSLCSVLPCVDTLPSNASNRANVCHAEKRNNNNTIIGLGLCDIYSDIDSFKAYATAQYENGTPITISGELDTPIHYTIDPQTLKTLRGTNNIWSSANDNIEIKYWKH